jgi:hypothetical protein
MNSRPPFEAGHVKESEIAPARFDYARAGLAA